MEIARFGEPLLNEVLGAAVIGDEIDAALRHEHIVVAGAEEVHGCILPTEGAQHLVARADVRGADQLVAVHVYIRPLGILTPSAPHIVTTAPFTAFPVLSVMLNDTLRRTGIFT